MLIKAKQKIKEGIEGEDVVHVAFSGGADSMATLCLVSESLSESQTVVAHYANHHVSKNANVWSDMNQDAVKKLNENSKGSVVFSEHHLMFESKANFESEARRKRYDAIINSMNEGETLFVGHHSDDQVENVIINLFKGRGIKGMTSLREVSKMDSITIKRPLLGCSKSDIVEYLDHHCVQYVTDESNASNDYDRNFIRNKIIPLALKRFPSLKKAVLASYESLSSTDHALSELVDIQLENISVDGMIDLEKFVGMSNNVKRLIIIHKLRNMGFFNYRKSAIMELCKQASNVCQYGKMKGGMLFKDKESSVNVTYAKHEGKRVMVFSFKN